MNNSYGTPMFTGDDYQLVADASYREEDRRELFQKLHGVAAPADDQLDRLADLAQRIALYMRRTEQGAETHALHSVSPADQAVIGASLRAATDGPFFEDDEFHTLFGLERREVAVVAQRWPFVDLTNEDVRLAVHGALGQLLGYPHGRERDWSYWLPVSPGALEAVAERWRASYP